jgi:hypothetical protein
LVDKTGATCACGATHTRQRGTHFLDFPHYAAVLLPLGVLLSLGAYIGRERLSPPRPQLAKLGIMVASFTLALALGLDILADEIAPHGHDH